MAESKEEKLLIGYLKVRDFMRIQVVGLRPNKTGLTMVQGKNAQGKSALLRAAKTLLEGLAAAPAKPVRDGAANAEIVADLGMHRIVRKWSDPEDRTKSTLSVEDFDGNKIPQPQKWLDEKLRSISDPLALLRLKPHELAREAFTLVKVPINLDEHKSRMSLVEAQRRDAKRDLAAHEKVLTEWQAKATGAPETPPDVSALTEAIEQAGRQKENRKARQMILDNADQDLTRARERLRALEEQMLAAHKDFGEAQKKRDEAAAALTECGDPPDVSDARVKLADATAQHQRYLDGKRYQEETAKHKALQGVLAEAEARLDTLRAQRAEALQAVVWPSDGLGFDPDQETLTLNGVPFDQASMAERLLASVDLATAKPSPIRALLIQDGSILDAEHLDLLDRHLQAKGWQALVEIVAEEPSEDGLWIEEGSGEFPKKSPKTA